MGPLTFRCNQSHCPHVNNIQTKFNYSNHNLISILRSNQSSIQKKILLVNTLLLPISLYDASNWGFPENDSQYMKKNFWKNFEIAANYYHKEWSEVPYLLKNYQMSVWKFLSSLRNLIKVTNAGLLDYVSSFTLQQDTTQDHPHFIIFPLIDKFYYHSLTISRRCCHRNIIFLDPPIKIL